MPDSPEPLYLAILFFVFCVLPGFATTWLLFPRGELDLFERVPLGFIFSLGLLEIVFLLAATLGWGWEPVRGVWAGVTVASAAGVIARWRIPLDSERARASSSRAAVGVLLLILLLAAALTLITPRDEDDWSYYQVVRGFIDAPQIAPLPLNSLRPGLNIWWLLHAFLIHTSGLDIVRLGREWMPLLLAPLAFLALYSLARTLLRSRTLAILACALQLAFFVSDLFYNDPNVQLAGGWVLGRIDQDHTAIQFIFMPVYTLSVVRFLQTGDWRWLGSNLVALLVQSVIHPEGLVQAGITLSGFLLLHVLLSNWREVWKRAVLALAPFLIGLLLFLPLALYWVGYVRGADADAASATQSGAIVAPKHPPSKPEAFDFGTLAPADAVFPATFRWLWFLSPDVYTFSPDVLTYPPLLAVLLLIPWLISAARTDLTARYFLGMIASLLLALYVPLSFALLSRQLGWNIYRLWYLFPSVLVIVYLGPRVVMTLARGWESLRRRVANRQALEAVFCIVGLALAASQFPSFWRGASVEFGVNHQLPEGALDIFEALRRFSSSEGGIVLAPRAMSDPVPSYRASFTPVVFRYNAPQERVEGVEAFYASPLLSSVNLSVLSKYQVDYLIAPVDKELISQLDLTPELFIPLHRNARWSLYQVAQPVVPTDVANANDLFREGDWQVAIDTYNAILVESPDSSLARTGLGMLLELLNKPKKAVQELEEAVRLEPRNLQAHYHLAGVYNQLGMADESRAHAEAAGPLIGGGNR